MTLWPNAKMDVYRGDGASYGQRCQVRIEEDGTIVLTYEDEEYNNSSIEWKGGKIGDGHFELSFARGSGKGTLHRTPDDEYLEGFWIEDGQEGMWRIDLNSN